MQKMIIGGLVVLNVLLGIGVWMQLAPTQTANADIGGNKGDFVSICGYSNSQTIVYVLEANSGRLAALRVDPLNKRIDVAAQADIGRALAGN